MSLVRAFQYTFDDSKWIGKLATATVLLFIPVAGWFILMGYGLRLIRRVANSRKTLPDWRNYTQDLTNGFMLFLGGLIYAAPILLFSCMTGVVWSLGGSEVATLFLCCISLTLLLYIVIMTPLFYSAIAQFAATGDFADFLNIPDRINDTTAHTDKVLPLLVNMAFVSLLGGVPVVLAGVSIGLLFSSPLLGLLCIVVLTLPATFALVLATVLSFHLIGQWGHIIGARRYTGYSQNDPY